MCKSRQLAECCRIVTRLSKYLSMSTPTLLQGGGSTSRFLQLRDFQRCFFLCFILCIQASLILEAAFPSGWNKMSNTLPFLPLISGECGRCDEALTNLSVRHFALLTLLTQPPEAELELRFTLGLLSHTKQRQIIRWSEYESWTST